MGILTNPELNIKKNEKSKLVNFLCNYHNIICFVLYLAGLVWFCLLGTSQFNSGTYFSENALLPGKFCY